MLTSMGAVHLRPKSPQGAHATALVTQQLSGGETVPMDCESLERSWIKEPRWHGVKRSYSAKEVLKLRGSYHIRHSVAELGAARLWDLLRLKDSVRALGALTGNQAVQQVKAGLKAIYLSGWQVAADANLAGQMYPDQSLYPANSVPSVVQKINQALLRADQIHSSEGNSDID